jgi:hypothetical protein
MEGVENERAHASGVLCNHPRASDMKRAARDRELTSFHLHRRGRATVRASLQGQLDKTPE